MRVASSARLRRTACVKRYLQSSLVLKYGGNTSSQIYEVLNQIEVVSSLIWITLYRAIFLLK